jgi:hypothetical protein
MQAKAREVYVPPVLQDLRAGTAELHIALEKRLPFFPIASIYLRSSA